MAQDEFYDDEELLDDELLDEDMLDEEHLDDDDQVGAAPAWIISLAVHALILLVMFHQHVK